MEQIILNFYERHRDLIFADLDKLVRLEGSTGETEKLKDVRDALVQLIKQRTDIDATVISAPNGHDMVKFTYGNGDERVLVVGHYDTVHPAGTFEIRQEENRLYGPGGYDMKAGLVSAIWMVKAYKELSVDPKKEIIFLFNADEETGSEESEAIIDDIARTCKAAVICEPSIVNGDLKTGRKGRITFAVDLMGKAAHAGNQHELGISAIEEMAREIQYLHTLTDYSLGTTLNVGTCTGGTAINVVAEHAHYEFEARIASLSEMQRIQDLVMNYEPTLAGISRSVTLLGNLPPMEESEGNMKLFALAKETGQKLGLEFGHQFVGGGSDGNHISALGIPVLDSMGACGNNAHTKQEFIFEDQYLPRMALLASTMTKI